MTVRARLAARLLGLETEVARAVAAQAEADAWAEFRRELNRSRRYERRFVLVSFPIRHEVPGRRWYDGDEGGSVTEVQSLLRSVDHTWASGGQVYALLPESDRATADAFLTRLRGLDPKGLVVSEARVVAFPEDGVTSGALLAALEGKPIEGTPRDTAVQSARRNGATAPDPGTVAT
jgi:hypothetical protein